MNKSFFIFFCILFCFNNFSFSQEEKLEYKNYKSFQSFNINYSWVNFGSIDEWSIDTDFDERRVYMHFTMGFETNIKRWLDLRLDILANYGSILNSDNFFSPSAFMLGTRFKAHNFEKFEPYIDLKFGVANVEGNDMWNKFAFIPLAAGFRSGVNYQIFKNVQFGFSFDNIGILYGYNAYYNILGDTFIDGPYFDLSRISFVSTDLIIQIKK